MVYTDSFRFERNKKESRHVNAGTLIIIYVFAKVGIFFQISAIIFKKNGVFTEDLKNFTYFCSGNVGEVASLRSFFDLLTQIGGACP